MECQRCGASYAVGDNYCSKCGRPLRANLPVLFGPRGLQVPWEQVRASVLRGAVVVAVGTAAELLRREVVRRATPSNMADALTRLWRARTTRRATQAESVPVHVQPSPEWSEAVTEVRSVFFRRIIVRR